MDSRFNSKGGAHHASSQLLTLGKIPLQFPQSQLILGWREEMYYFTHWHIKRTYFSKFILNLGLLLVG